MLVRDPEKRYTISQIKRHRWMHKKGHEDETRSPGSNVEMSSLEEGEVKVGRKCAEPINEGLIKVMGDLGIDTNVTREVRERKLSVKSRV